jgi:hypothetical protein
MMTSLLGLCLLEGRVLAGFGLQWPDLIWEWPNLLKFLRPQLHGHRLRTALPDKFDHVRNR